MPALGARPHGAGVPLTAICLIMDAMPAKRGTTSPPSGWLNAVGGDAGVEGVDDMAGSAAGWDSLPMLVRCPRRERQKTQHRRGDLLAAVGFAYRPCGDLRGKVIALHAWRGGGLTVGSVHIAIKQISFLSCSGRGAGALVALAIALPAAAQTTTPLSCNQATRNYQAVNGAPVREPRTVELAWRDVQRVCGAASSAEPPPQQYVGPASTDPRPAAPMAPTGSNFSQQRSPLK